MCDIAYVTYGIGYVYNNLQVVLCKKDLRYYFGLEGFFGGEVLDSYVAMTVRNIFFQIGLVQINSSTILVDFVIYLICYQSLRFILKLFYF